MDIPTESPRYWAIGDVHGCLTALNTLLAALELQPTDRLIFLGDLIDRGPDSRGVIDRIIALRNERPVEVIQGNHEEMLIIARDLPGYAQVWQQYGGRQTLASYGWTAGISEGWPQAIPQEHWKFITGEMVDAVVEAGHLCVHGGIDATLPLDEQPWNQLRWLKWNDPKPHPSGLTVVCGHTHQVSGEPLTVGHHICIDTWVYGVDGWLTALNLATQEYVQANQRGAVRRGVLLQDGQHHLRSGNDQHQREQAPEEQGTAMPTAVPGTEPTEGGNKQHPPG
jgi:serine/threonine protein phosphatase 1